MDKKLGYLFLICCFGFVVNCNKDSERKGVEQKEGTASSVGYTTYPLPDSLSLFGERIPLEKNHVQQALDLELTKNTYWHSNTLLMIKRSALYFPTIDSVLSAEKVPADFRYLAAAESNLNPTIVSPAKAKGLWQFLSGTAKDMGLEVNDEVDERSHLIKSTKAAAKYLKILKDSTQHWSLAAASYNAGLGNIRKAIRKQKPNGDARYFDLELFTETERYIYRIAALKLIFSNPEAYGFNQKRFYAEEPTSQIQIKNPIPNIYDWCNTRQISIRELRHLNPWLIGESLSVSKGKSYQIKIPKR